MSRINKIITTVRNTEINTLTDEIITEYANSELSTDEHLVTIFDLLQPLNNKLTEAINRIKAESNLAEKDKLRDNKLRAVYFLTVGFVHHPNSTISSAAKVIDAVLKHYGVDIVNQSYATESSLIESLLVELAKEDLQAYIASLSGLSQSIEELSAAQSLFEEAQVKFQTEKAAEGTKENASEIKKEVIVIINNKLVVYLRAMVMVDESKYGKFGRVVAQTIEDMNVIIKKRKKTVVAKKNGDN